MTSTQDNTTSESKGIQSVDRAMALLMELSLVTRDIDLAELARKTGLTKSTASRLLSTMQKRGLVRQNASTRRFSLGTELIRLGSVALSQLWRPESFHIYLERLAQLTGETASVAVLEGDKAVYIDQVSSQSIIRSFPPVGARVDLHSTAVGKVLLTGLPRDRALTLAQKAGLPAFTLNTITDPAALSDALSIIETQGFAVDDEETEPGGRCLAAPIRSHGGEVVAAIGISGPTLRVTRDRVADLAEALRTVSAEVSAQLGYTPPRGRNET